MKYIGHSVSYIYKLKKYFNKLFAFVGHGVSHFCKLVSYLDEMLEFVSNGISYIYKRSGIIWIKCLNLLVMMFHI